jgi:hypothetical protein
MQGSSRSSVSRDPIQYSTCGSVSTKKEESLQDDVGSLDLDVKSLKINLQVHL